MKYRGRGSSRGGGKTAGDYLGLVLLLLRMEKRWTRTQLASRTGISIQQLGRIERREIARPSSKTWERVRRVGLGPEVVHRIGPRLWAIEAQACAVVHRSVSMEPPGEPREPDQEPYEIFGATF
jgi:hypothetical protein